MTHPSPEAVEPHDPNLCHKEPCSECAAVYAQQEQRPKPVAEAHTPTPWKRIHDCIYTEKFHDPVQGLMPILKLRLPPRARVVIGQPRIDGDFIVRAVNSHEPLKEALRAAIFAIEHGPANFAVVERLKKALALAEDR